MGTSRRPQPLRLPSKLQRIRTQLGLTQEKLAKALKSSRSRVYPGHISEFERGKREPSALTLLGYARLAGVPMEVLVDDKAELPTRLPGPRKKNSKR